MVIEVEGFFKNPPHHFFGINLHKLPPGSFLVKYCMILIMEDKEHVSPLESIMPKGWLDSEYPDKKPVPDTATQTKVMEQPKPKKTFWQRFGLKRTEGFSSKFSEEESKQEK